MQEKVSVIVPCYNEQEALPYFYNEFTSTMHQISYDYELILVNDGSKDQTLQVIKELAKKDSHIVYLSFSRNFGKEAAMYAGFHYASGDYIAVMDADMQDPPSLLPKMLKILKSGEYDSVATRRADREGEPLLRSWFARKFYQIINRISDSEIVDGARDFRLMKRSMADAVMQLGEYNRFSKGIFGWVGFRTCWMPYENVRRIAGKTKWDFWNLCKYAVDGIINFSQAPLYLSSLFGIVMTVLSAVCLAVIIVRRVCFGDPVAGWASLICVVIFMAGIQLFCIGITGQYIAKIYMETKHRPHYIIAETNCGHSKKVRFFEGGGKSDGVIEDTI